MEVVNVTRRGRGQPRAIQVPDVLTHEELDTLYDFCFEWFGTDRGVHRLNTATDDDPEPDATDAMQKYNAPVVLFDRDEHQWVPIRGGMWIVEPKDEHGDGFIAMSDLGFHEDWEVAGG